MSGLQRKISRRALLRGSAVSGMALAATAFVGCGSSDDEHPVATEAAAPAPVGTPVVSATRAAASGTASWARLAPSSGPGARRDHSLTFNADDGLIYMFGGRAKGIADDELWTFDPARSTWAQIYAGGGPEPRFAHDASYDAAGRRLLVALGQGNGGAFFNDIWAFGDGRWSRLDRDSPERPEIRYGAGGAHDEAGNRILISHGFTDRGRFDDTWAFDLTAGTWMKISTTGAVPIRRCLTRCLWQAGALLMFGGQTDDNPFLGDFWSLDTGRGIWSERRDATLPGPRNLYGASFDEMSLRWYIVGGNTAGGPTNETWFYDATAASWSQLEAAGVTPPARYSCDAAHAGATLYIFGGHDGTAETDDVWALTTSAT